MALTDFKTLSVHTKTAAKFSTLLLNQQQLNHSGIRNASVMQYKGSEMCWHNQTLCFLCQGLFIGKKNLDPKKVILVRLYGTRNTGVCSIARQ